MFLSVHCGPFGGHRGADKTVDLVLRVAWWPDVQATIEEWVDKCWQCLQYRRRALKSPGGFFLPSSYFPWMHVIVDFEGPSTPKTNNGAAYVFEYLDVLSKGVLYEAVVDLTHAMGESAITWPSNDPFTVTKVAI